MVQPVDAYGNAQTIHPERRALSIFSNDVQREALSGYQTMGRRTSQRGSDAPFALPGDRFMQAMAGRNRFGSFLPGGWLERPNALGLKEREKKAAFSSYGGFGERRNPYAAGDPEGVLARKRNLITATGSTAPIERSKLSRGTLGSHRFPIAQTPFAAQAPSTPQNQNHDPNATSTNPHVLSKFLTTEAKVLHQRASSEGWKQFSAADYRGAIRTFESAAMLDESDFKSRAGIIFGYVTIGSFNAAHATLKSLQMRGTPLFEADLPMNNRYGDPGTAQQIRLTVMAMAEASEQSADTNALAIFALWYMGGKEDALRAARLLESKDTARRYADWPKQMQEAMNKPAGP